jgi:hypothetical protein
LSGLAISVKKAGDLVSEVTMLQKESCHRSMLGTLIY